jgi:hypothetical protein
VPAATPKRDAVRARILETVCGDMQVSFEVSHDPVFRTKGGEGESKGAVSLLAPCGCNQNGGLTRALCWTLSCTIGWMTSSFSSSILSQAAENWCLLVATLRCAACLICGRAGAYAVLVASKDRFRFAGVIVFPKSAAEYFSRHGYSSGFWHVRLAFANSKVGDASSHVGSRCRDGGSRKCAPAAGPSGRT